MAKVEREADRYVKDKWYQHIWYHYKVQICIVAFLVIAAFAFIYSASTKSDIDLYVMYITSDPEFYNNRVDALEICVSYFVEDITKDGKINVFVDNIYIGPNHETDTVYKNKEKIMTNLRAGTCFLIFTDDTGLEYMVTSDALCDLGEEFSDLDKEKYPNVDLSGYYYTLNDTPFFNHSVMDIWDNDGRLYMSLRKFKGTIAEMNANSQQTFELSKQSFLNIVTDTTIN